MRPLAEPQSFYEPYGRQDYLRTHTGRIGSAGGGAFLVRVTLPQGVSSRSVCVATGSREVFAGGTDLGRALERIRSLGGPLNGRERDERDPCAQSAGPNSSSNSRGVSTGGSASSRPVRWASPLTR